VAEPSPSRSLDLFIIGGGVNGVGIARDAVGRGLSVALVEKDDLASATSSASSKLVHGGLRYLEQYAFRLVREGLAEREVLMRIAPHLVHPLRFVMPHQTRLRPAWIIRTGLFLYDRLGGKSATLPGTRGLDLTRDPMGAGLRQEFRKGFAYSDCRVDDARLVVVNARDAADRGALILTRTRCTAARREGGLWHVTAQDTATGAERRFTARILVNAGGPWAGDVALRIAAVKPRQHLRLVKGSHVVVPPLYDGDHAFLLQNDDGRIVFVIPYEGRFSLVGTTDVALGALPDKAAISPEEVIYLQRAVAQYFQRSFAPADVLWSYAGIRPLYDDGAANPSAVTRDYVLELDAGAAEAPLLSVFGGKITTYRKLAEHALEKLAPFIPGLRPAWTAEGKLPGSDIGPAGPSEYAARLAAQHSALPATLIRDLVRRHGATAVEVLGDAKKPGDLGEDFGGGLCEREVRHFIRREWARTAEDILWRRSKVGLHLPPGSEAKLARFLAEIA